MLNAKLQINNNNNCNSCKNKFFRCRKLRKQIKINKLKVKQTCTENIFVLKIR